jgi:hypothetical protein
MEERAVAWVGNAKRTASLSAISSVVSPQGSNATNKWFEEVHYTLLAEFRSG